MKLSVSMQHSLVLSPYFSLYSHTNTHALLPFICPELIDLNILASSFRHLFCSFQSPPDFLRSIFCMEVRLQRWIVSLFASCHNFEVSVLPLIFHIFSNTQLFINLKKYFSKSLLAFVLSFVSMSS